MKSSSLTAEYYPHETVVLARLTNIPADYAWGSSGLSFRTCNCIFAQHTQSSYTVIISI